MRHVFDRGFSAIARKSPVVLLLAAGCALFPHKPQTQSHVQWVVFEHLPPHARLVGVEDDRRVPLAFDVNGSVRLPFGYGDQVTAGSPESEKAAATVDVLAPERLPRRIVLHVPLQEPRVDATLARPQLAAAAWPDWDGEPSEGGRLVMDAAIEDLLAGRTDSAERRLKIVADAPGSPGPGAVEDAVAEFRQASATAVEWDPAALGVAAEARSPWLAEATLRRVLGQDEVGLRGLDALHRAVIEGRLRDAELIAELVAVPLDIGQASLVLHLPSAWLAAERLRDARRSLARQDVPGALTYAYEARGMSAPVADDFLRGLLKNRLDSLKVSAVNFDRRYRPMIALAYWLCAAEAGSAPQNVAASATNGSGFDALQQALRKVGTFFTGARGPDPEAIAGLQQSVDATRKLVTRRLRVVPMGEVTEAVRQALEQDLSAQLGPTVVLVRKGEPADAELDWSVEVLSRTFSASKQTRTIKHVLGTVRVHNPAYDEAQRKLEEAHTAVGTAEAALEGAQSAQGGSDPISQSIQAAAVLAAQSALLGCKATEQSAEGTARTTPEEIDKKVEVDAAYPVDVFAVEGKARLLAHTLILGDEHEFKSLEGVGRGQEEDTHEDKDIGVAAHPAVEDHLTKFVPDVSGLVAPLLKDVVPVVRAGLQEVRWREFEKLRRSGDTTHAIFAAAEYASTAAPDDTRRARTISYLMSTLP